MAILVFRFEIPTRSFSPNRTHLSLPMEHRTKCTLKWKARLLPSQRSILLGYSSFHFLHNPFFGNLATVKAAATSCKRRILTPHLSPTQLFCFDKRSLLTITATTKLLPTDPKTCRRPKLSLYYIIEPLPSPTSPPQPTSSTRWHSLLEHIPSEKHPTSKDRSKRWSSSGSAVGQSIACALQ